MIYHMTYSGVAPVDYIPDLLTPERADNAFAVLNQELPWGRHNLPRDEVYFNDTPAPYTYGSPGRERTYLPETEWHPMVNDIRVILENRLGLYNGLDVCFLNRYVGPRDQLGWHADDSPEMDPARPIVTVSLGAERFIMFKEALDGVVYAQEELLLGHGSAAVMRPGMQKTWLHRIPKSSRSDIGTRISLTFRGFLDLRSS